MNRDLSIIVPIYNIQKYIRKCIDSIINQSFNDYECLLLDDGSSDECGSISDEYALKDKRIIAIHKTNSGVSNTRNIGLEVCSSRYVTFCDGDDYYTEGWLHNLMNEVYSSNSDFVTSGYKYIDELDNDLIVFNRQIGLWELNSKKDRIDYIISQILYNGNGWEVWSEVFKKEIIENNSVRFCETCDNYAEDLAFVLSYCLYAHKLSAISGTGYRYVKHNNSMITRSTSTIKLNSLNEVSKFFGNRFFELYPDEVNNDSFNKIHFYIMHLEASRLFNTNKLKDVKQLKKEYEKIIDKQWNDTYSCCLSNLPDYLRLDAEYMNSKKGYYYFFKKNYFKIRRYTLSVFEVYGRKIRNYINRKRLKNKDFSIISSNCNGGVMAHDLGVRFNTPFINVGFHGDDFVKLLNNPKHYIYDCELKFVKPEIDGAYIVTGKETYPVAMLDDIYLYFVHDTSKEVALDNWNRRKNRINWDNLFIVFTDRDLCSYDTIASFDKLPYENKIIFTNKEYPEFKSAVYIKGFEKDKCVGVCSNYMNAFGKRYLDQFNYVKWLNGNAN